MWNMGRGVRGTQTSFIQIITAGMTWQQMMSTHGEEIIVVEPRRLLQWEILGEVTGQGMSMGSKRDSLQSALNKGNPMGESFHNGRLYAIYVGTKRHSLGLLHSLRSLNKGYKYAQYDTISWIFVEPKTVNARWCFHF